MKKINVFLILVLAPFLFVPNLLESQKLTGIWQDNNGTRYSFRQVGNELYWRMDGRPIAHNVFYGTVTGKTVTGEWVDLPGGQRMGNGTIAMELVTNDLLRKIAQNGNYGASEWRRIPVFTQPIDIPITKPPITEPTPEPLATDWKEVFSFGAPKNPLGELLPPPETDLMDVVVFDQTEEEEPQARLEITDIELEDHTNPKSKACHWPGTIMITIQNFGEKAVDANNRIGIRGSMTMIGFTEEKGYYERIVVPLHFGRGSREWGRLKHGMPPFESKIISANFTSLKGFTVTKTAHFFVRVELTRPVWDEDAQQEKYIVEQAVVREFNPRGFDLSIPKESIYIREEKGGKASLLIQVKNVGELTTPGPVAIRVFVPVIDQKSVTDYWVEFLHNFGKPLRPGEMIYTDPKILQS